MRKGVEAMKISTILDQVDLGSLVLPEFQRGYVWNRDQVKRLMASLYRGHPIGTLMVWKTTSDQATLRGDHSEQAHTVSLLLDGQQRITTLYGIIRGQPPQFFEGNANNFAGLYFNFADEIFEFYAPMRMRGNSAWIDVTQLMKIGAGNFVGQLVEDPNYRGRIQEILDRLNRIGNIKERELYIEEITGADKTVNVVVEIFNNVNSGGTKLSQGDLALAKVCASWPEARQEMNQRLVKWQNAGFNFTLGWLLRTVNAVVTGDAFFTALKDVETPQIREGLARSEKLIDAVLNQVSSRLGLDHSQVLKSVFAFPVMARYLNQHDGRFTDYRERDRMLFWYIQTFLWGRYAGSTETVLSQDLHIVNEPENTLGALIDQIRQMRPDLKVVPNDFLGTTVGARFYPLLYMLTRVCQSRDLASGIVLNANLLGRMSRLEVHHIFPKALLKRHGYSQGEANAIANFTFLTKETNLAISDLPPEKYLPHYEQLHPGVLATHWIPTDPALWHPERYRDFLAARREILAQATNTFLESLLHGTTPEEAVAPAIMEHPPQIAEEMLFDDDPEIQEAQRWVLAQGLPTGEAHFELIDRDTGVVDAILDLAWPDGLQEGYSEPVALVTEEDSKTIKAAHNAGFRCFNDFAALKGYIEQEVLKQ
jgi:hypothetical protein